MSDHRAHNDQRINYSFITANRTLDARLQALDDEVSRVKYICLTDAISHQFQGGVMTLELLAKERSNTMYKVRVLKDEWGNPPVPGEKITRKIEKQRKDRAGRKLRGRTINDLKRRGVWNSKFVETREWVIDNDGCITLPQEDATWLLQMYGVHFESGEALSGHRELSSGPCKAPSGDMLHVHYWRYEEVPPWVETKPLVPPKPKPTRGRKPKTDTGLVVAPETISE